MVSLIVTAWKEQRTIGRALYALLSQARDMGGEFELILVCPDRETYEAGARVASGFREIPFVYIKDPLKGKPFALNLAFEKAKGSVMVLTDGDVWIDRGSLASLLKPFSDPSIAGVTGRPVCRNSRSTMWGYWGHLFMDAAHEKRVKTLAKGVFYAMSGYLLAIRKLKIVIPSGVLDDVYLSCYLNEKGKKIVYAPEARVLVSQPSTLHDWISQKVRSMSGYRGLQQMFPRTRSIRTFAEELEFALFPVMYSRSPREFCWSLIQYPVRLYLWIATYANIWMGRRATDLWVRRRIESTK